MNIAVHMKGHIAHKLHQIYQHILSDVRENDISLYSGSAGVLLFKILYARHYQEDLDSGDALERIIESNRQPLPYTFCGGKAGIYWLYDYLHTIDLLDQEDLELLLCEEETLKAACFHYLTANNWDILHGATGIAYAFLYTQKRMDEAFFGQFFTLLREKLVVKDHAACLLRNKNIHSDTGEYLVDLGMAHGLAGMLRFCTCSYSAGICRDQARDMADKLICYFMEQINRQKEYCCFPDTVPGTSRESRLAWCYGDLGIGFALYQAGRVFEQQETMDMALAVLLHSTGRRSPAVTGIHDAGICHGTAGVAHIYYKMWRYSGLRDFKEAAEYWIQQTLEMDTHQDGIAGYKAFNPVERSWMNVPGLLEGAAGIGLVLLSYLTEDCSWDYCLMLDA